MGAKCSLQPVALAIDLIDSLFQHSGMSKSDGGNAVAPSPTVPRAAAYGPLIVAAFLSSFAAVCVFLHSHLSFPSVPGIAPRFQYFARHKDEFDTVFIGSSHIRHGIVPQQFDEEMATQHVSTHSFNLAFSGMWPPESCYYLRQVLALRPRKLRWVFIELMDFRGQAEGEVPTMRSVYWHDVQHTGMAWRLVSELSMSPLDKIDLFATHTWEFVQNMTNPGRGADWIEQRYFPVKNKVNTSWISRRGFDSEPEGGWATGAKAQYRNQIEAFQRARQRTPMRPGLAEAMQKLAGEVERAGAKAIFVVLPTVRPEEHFDAASSPRVRPVLGFDNPTQYPRLYLPELHYDSGHFNENGAREFSAVLAKEFANSVASPLH